MGDKTAKIDSAARLNRNLALLQAGAKITIDITTPAGQKNKFITTLIGYLPKQYVLVQFPDSSKLGNFAQYLNQGTAVTVRGLIEGHEGSVVAFVSSIKQTIQLPSKIIVLDFPRTVSLQSLRSSIRIDTEIFCKIKMANELWDSTIRDVSINGCQLFVENAEQLLLSKEKSTTIVIDKFQTLSNLNLEAVICTIKPSGSGIAMGLQFDESSKEQVIKLLHNTVTHVD